MANCDHQCCKFAVLALAKDLKDPFAEGGQIGTRWEYSGHSQDCGRLGAGRWIGVAGMIGAGTASAAPGISYDGGPGDPVGIGDNSATGAQANASNDNRALAISVFRPATATADGQNRTGNTVFALDGTAGFLKTNTYPYTDDHDNQVVAINGTALHTVRGPTWSPSAATCQQAHYHLRGWHQGLHVRYVVESAIRGSQHRGSGMRTTAQKRFFRRI